MISRPANTAVAIVLLLHGALPTCVAQNGAPAPERAASIAPYLNDDTLVVVHVDLAKIDPDALAVAANQLVSAANGDEEVLRPVITTVQSALKALRGAGVGAFYAVMGVADIARARGPLVILETNIAAADDFDGQIKKLTVALAPTITTKRVGRVVLIGKDETVNEYERMTATRRDDLTAAIDRAGARESAFAIVASPGNDFRRVVREIWPDLPGPLAPLRGELADRWQRLELEGNFPPQGEATLSLRTTDPAAAETALKLWRDLPAVVELVRGNRGQLDQKMKQKVESLLAAFSPRVEGNDVVVELPADDERLANLTKLALDVMHMGMESAWHRERMQKFKQLALAMHNLAAPHKRLPSSAIRDDDGRPLLSWRVAVLPYVEQGELFNQFHLDEPWDSPHNKTLIEKMPSIFADPDARLKKLAREGRTTFQVPVGKATMFFNDEGATFRDITDGTSNTIMIIEVAPDEAAIWTQPDDWEFDEQNPRRGLERQDRDTFVTAFADGSAHTLPVKLKRETLKALVTRAGQEIVKDPYETDED